MGINTNDKCELCGETEEDITRTRWCCKPIHTEESCKKLKNQNREDIPRNLKLGAPNAKARETDDNFFGKNEYETKTEDDEMKEMMGMQTSRRDKWKAKFTNGMAERTFKNI